MGSTLHPQNASKKRGYWKQWEIWDRGEAGGARCQLEAFDEAEKIGEAVHERARVNVAKFASRVAQKIHHGGHGVHREEQKYFRM
jgi:hypothetical protein